MKRILSVLLGLFISLATIPAYAEFTPSILQGDRPVIAVIIGGQGAIRSNEKAMNSVREKLAEKFPKSKYELITDSKLVQDILIFNEDEDVEDITQIKRSQLAKFGQSRNYDYVISLLFGLGHGRSGADFWTLNYDIDVDMQAKVVDVATGQYVYRQNIMGHGRSAAGIGMPSSVNAFAKAVNKCMETFDKEVNISPIKPKKEEKAEYPVMPANPKADTTATK